MGAYAYVVPVGGRFYRALSQQYLHDSGHPVAAPCRAAGCPYGAAAKSLRTGDTTITYVSDEDVTVPAGTFKDCPKISLVGTYDKESGGTNEHTYTTWYAKGVGMVKETIIDKSTFLDEEDIETTVTNELMSATVNGITYE